jgi:hypothetical protein
MLKYSTFVLLIIITTSCSDRHELVIKNNSKNNVYVFYSELDSNISNRWIYEYSQKYNYANSVPYLTMRDLIEPNKWIRMKYESVDQLINYKLYLYFIRYDSLLLLKKTDLDSTLISRFLLKKCVVKAEDIFKQKTLEVCYP